MKTATAAIANANTPRSSAYPTTGAKSGIASKGEIIVDPHKLH
jgi:hypothetical protein